MNSNIIVGSRIRLARNLKNQAFTNNTDLESANNVLTSVFNALSDISNFNLYKCKNLKSDVLEEMLEDHLISSELINNSDISGVAISADNTVSIMVNEEDHIREQCFLEGLNLKRAYDIISDIDQELGASLNFAYDDELGFLTACPTNVGTGLRASVMMFLPGITLTNNVQEMVNAVSSFGLCVRGAYGEGSSASGYLFQISNQFSLGKTEEEIVQLVESTALKICDLEIRARKLLLDNNKDLLTDEVLRAYGVLSNCYKISTSEATELLSKVKLGADIDLIKLKDCSVVSELLKNISPTKINKLSQKALTEIERDKFRAEYIGRVIKNNRIY
ncbi:MAG: ATP--guanido phosphotransferase [Clostridia bacterium]|nr:ATP--guanido phosphotransferase [Clostridia bacterium]